MSATPPHHVIPPPNHHADHPGFAGIGGVIAAICFTIGRTAAADLAIALTGAGPGDDVVDIGCGPGVAARRAAARGASSVTGVDPASVMLRVARAATRTSRRAARVVRYRAGAAESLPLPDRSATVVWSLATVHHWHDLDAGLAEARRVLGPSGRFLAIERQVEPAATGVSSHGWTDDQAHAFGQRCHAAGFSGVSIDHHRSGRRQLISVLAHTA